MTVIGHKFLLTYLVFQTSPTVSSSILTGQRPYCVGETAVLTCNITQGILLRWRYGDEFLVQHSDLMTLHQLILC